MPETYKEFIGSLINNNNANDIIDLMQKYFNINAEEASALFVEFENNLDG